MRIFTRLRKVFFSYKELSDKLNHLEVKTGKHEKEIQYIFEAIKRLMTIPENPKRKIGFYLN